MNTYQNYHQFLHYPKKHFYLEKFPCCKILTSISNNLCLLYRDKLSRITTFLNSLWMDMTLFFSISSNSFCTQRPILKPKALYSCKCQQKL